ncbi:MAG: hypothetical protein CMM28_11335 [Rhodospirillaceae bacterium]|nr:hypothetical protein [Rhodospirillaceae bacterium]
MRRCLENWWFMKKIVLPLALLCASTSLAQAADFLAGRNAYIRGDFQVAYQEFLPLAKKGDPKSRVGVGLLYAKGQGVQQDDVEAHRWFTLVAEQKPKPNVYVHTVAVENRKVLTKRMSQKQIAKAHQLVGATQVAELSSDVTVNDGYRVSSETPYQIAEVEVSPPPTPEAPKMNVTSPTAPSLPAGMTPEVITRPLNIIPITPRKPSKTEASNPPAKIPVARSSSHIPHLVERHQLQPPTYLSKTILPGGGGSQTTTIGVISSNSSTSKINDPNAAQPDASAETMRTVRPIQTAALTQERRKSTGHSVLIQLGAYKDSPRSIAERAWDRIQRMHGKVIGNLEPIIIEADLGAMGTFQRLRTGPFATMEDAKLVCKQLRSRHQRCYVIRSIL